MNANETAPKVNSRLKRIQKVSRILQFCVVVYFFAPLVVIVFNLKRVHLANGMISIFNHPYASTEHIPNVMFVLSGAGLLAYLLGVFGLSPVAELV